MKRKSILVMAVFLCISLLVTVVALVGNACHRDADIKEKSDIETDSVFLPGLDPKIVQQIEEVKQKHKGLADKATQEQIGHLIPDLGRDREMIESHGKRVPVEAMALNELRKIGKAAIPQLIDAIGTNQNDSIRSTSLLNVFQLAKKDVENISEYLPVFVRSMWDKAPRVRRSAVAQNGQAARAFNSKGSKEQIELCTQYLVKALSDEDDGVQSHAATCLDVIGRIDLVPKEMIEKYGTGGFRP